MRRFPPLFFYPLTSFWIVAAKAPTIRIRLFTVAHLAYSSLQAKVRRTANVGSPTSQYIVAVEPCCTATIAIEPRALRQSPWITTPNENVAVSICLHRSNHKANYKWLSQQYHTLLQESRPPSSRWENDKHAAACSSKPGIMEHHIKNLESSFTCYS